MLITRYCNLIGTANIPAVHTKTCPNTPDVFSPLPSFRRAQYMCARKYAWLARLGAGVVVRRYIDFLILLIPTPLVSVLFAAASLLFVHF